MVTFIRKVENLEYVEALKLLAQRAGMTVPESGAEDQAARLKSRILEINRETARFYYSCLTEPAGRPALDYLTGRGLSVKTVKRFGLGYAPESWDRLANHLSARGFSQEELIAASVVAVGRSNRTYDMFRGRVIFPIIDLRGNVIGFGGRLMGEAKGPKYLNSPDTPVFKKSRNLFAMNIAKSSKANEILLCEGYMDVIALHQAGFDQAVATLGTSLTAEQSRLISQYSDNVIVAYDNDGAGQKATARAINLFGQLDVRIRVLSIQGAKDPDEYIRKFGAKRFEMLLSGSSSAMDFEINKIRERYDLESSDGKVGFLKEFTALAADINNPIQRDVYIGAIAQQLAVDKNSIVVTVEEKIRKKRKSDEKRKNRDLRVYADRGEHKPPEEIGRAVAEEKLLASLIKNPDTYQNLRQKLPEESMSDEDCRQIYSLLLQRLEEGLAIEPIHLSGLLNDRQMGKLVRLTAENDGHSFTQEETDDYINAIMESGRRKSMDQVAKMDDDQLKEYINSLASGKK